jgi:phenylacetate-coenzyme A ligase PaaK-like adenylate-forming protein
MGWETGWEWADEAEAEADEERFLRMAMRWHFSEATGSKFWLDRAASLDFDPLRDICTHEDLARFPNVVNELRDVPVGDLVPRGYGARPDAIAAYDSGGTTGAPKRVLLFPDWLERSLAWKSGRLDALEFPTDVNWLIVAPTGPHIFGRLMTDLARMRGGVPFTVDLDPRWVRACLREGRMEEADRYAEHIVDQVEAVLDSQEVGVLVATPPLLERMAARDVLVEHIGKKVDAIMWGGAHMDPDTRFLLQQDVFPGVRLRGQYGSTMILGGSMERAHHPDPRSCVFDSFSPYTTFSVIDPATGQNVAEGQRGQVVMHHISKALLLPNNLERDSAASVAAPAGALGVSVADVAPVATFEDSSVIEGVY